MLDLEPGSSSLRVLLDNKTNGNIEYFFRKKCIFLLDTRDIYR